MKLEADEIVTLIARIVGDGVKTSTSNREEGTATIHFDPRILAANKQVYVDLVKACCGNVSVRANKKTGVMVIQVRKGKPRSSRPKPRQHQRTSLAEAHQFFESEPIEPKEEAEEPQNPFSQFRDMYPPD
jgi:hypothetical protein